MENLVSSLDGVGLRLLGLLIVVGADVDVELAELGPAETVVRNHASDGALDEELGFARAHFLGARALQDPCVCRARARQSGRVRGG